MSVGDESKDVEGVKEKGLLILRTRCEEVAVLPSLPILHPMLETCGGGTGPRGSLHIAYASPC